MASWLRIRNGSQVRLTAFGEVTWDKSGRKDLNLRPHGPEPCALAKLSYAPSFTYRIRLLDLVNANSADSGGLARVQSAVGRRQEAVCVRCQLLTANCLLE